MISPRAKLRNLGLFSTLLYFGLWLCENRIFWLRTDANRSQGFLLALGWYLVVLALLIVYRQTIALAEQEGATGSVSLKPWLVFPVIQATLLLLTRPYMSSDLYAYVAHGVVAHLPNGNPYLEGSTRAMASSLGSQFLALGWNIDCPPTPYGPLWSWIEVLATAASSSVVLSALILKAVGAVSYALAAWALWKVLSRLAPTDRLRCFVAFLANPLLLIQLINEGHNDGLMVAFSLMALAWTLKGRTATGLISVGCAVLTKFVPVIFAPSQLMYSGWQNTEGNRKRLLAPVALASAVSVSLFVGLGWRFWGGSATFQGIADANQAGSTTVVAILFKFFSHFVATATAQWFAKLAVLGTLGATIAWSCTKVRTREDLIHAWARTSFVYYYVVSGRNWPWYAALPLGLYSALPGREARRMVFALTIGPLFGTPISLLKQGGILTVAQASYFYTAVAIYLPLLVLAVHHVPGRRADQSLSDHFAPKSAS